MYCPNCNERILGNEKFCSNCGYMLKSFNSNEDNLKKENPETIVTPVINGNKRKSSILIIVLFIFLSISILLFLYKDTIFARGKRTIMIYIVGSDLESKYNSASSDIYEMMTSGADFSNINLLLYTGGAKGWYKDNISSEENAIYKVEKNKIVKLESYPIMDMGDESTLVEFLNYGFENYKAEKYSLILWDHGGGPIYGFGLDEYNKLNYLSLLELKNALSNSHFGNKNKLEFIGFDACLMSSIEVASQLKNYANYMVASEEVEPGSGWNYSFLSNINTKSTAYEIGKDIVDTYNNFYMTDSLVNGTSLALIDLSKVSTVEEKLNDLFKDVDSDLIFNFSSISRSRSISKSYGKTTTISYDLVDLHDLVSVLPSNYDEKKKALIDSLSDFVVYQLTDLRGTNGISIYFPYENRSKLSTIMSLYKKFNFANEYTKFIENFANRLGTYSVYSFDFFRTIPTEIEDEISVNLNEEEMKDIANASYLILEKDGDYYIPRYKGTDVKIEDSRISTHINKKSLVVSDKEGNSLYLTAFEKEKTDDYTKYIIPATVQNWNEEDGSNFESVPIYVEYVVRKGENNGNIVGAFVIDLDTNLSSKVAVDIYKWKVIQFINSKYKIFDENGEYTKDWDSSSEVVVFESRVDDFEINIDDFDSSKDNYALFNILDVTGKEYVTNVVKLQLN